MRFDELDSRMRVYETSHDHCVLPGIHMVARLDGRNFTRLTREIHQFDAPYDRQFRDYMVETVQHLMNCGFRVVYGYTQSDEISLLCHRDIDTFGRKLRKFNSILAGEASAKFSLLSGAMASFDCRICQLPNLSIVYDYFHWRQADAHRNALNGHCYWLLRSEGRSAQQATKNLLGMSVAEKNELLFQHGINFNDLPNWQKRGIGLHWETYTKIGFNPKTSEEVEAIRRRIAINYDLMMKDGYTSFLDKILAEVS